MNISNEKMLTFGNVIGKNWHERKHDNGFIGWSDSDIRVTGEDLRLLAFDWLEKNKWKTPWGYNKNTIHEEYSARIEETAKEDRNIRTILETIIDLAIEMNEIKCEHKLVPAKNKVIKDGYVCLKCGTLRADAETKEAKT